MLNRMMDRRKLVAGLTLALLAGCATGPKAPPSPPPPPPPNADVLPTDSQRHRVALLVPLSGPNGGAGQSIANAATMALLDTNADNLRITTYDTSAGAAAAAAKAVQDGNKLILGPLLSADIPQVSPVARSAHVPVISFSNDEDAASRDVFIMGEVPGQSVARTLSYARGQGAARIAALVPAGEYGQRVSSSIMSTVRGQGGSVVAMENYDRANASVTAAARRLRQKGGYDAVMIADGGRIAALAAPLVKGPA
jgi:outer membrane PBP1 activator LpoA protein